MSHKHFARFTVDTPDLFDAPTGAAFTPPMTDTDTADLTRLLNTELGVDTEGHLALG